jgi:hypothetical protein
MGDDEELPPLAVQPRGSDGGPAGAQQYDDTASMLLAARQGPDALARHLEQARGYQFDEGYNGVQGGELPAVGEGPDEPEQPAVQQPSDYQAQLAALQARIERNQQMQEQGVNAAFERSRPSESEKWLSLAAALASPTQTGSLGETMGNVFQSLAGYKRGVRQAESTRQSELARLRQAYDLAGINATVRGMKPRTAASLAFDTLGQARNKATGELMADSKGRPVVRNNEDYLRLSAGSEFVDINGNIRRKPGG